VNVVLDVWLFFGITSINSDVAFIMYVFIGERNERRKDNVLVPAVHKQRKTDILYFRWAPDAVLMPLSDTD